MTRTFHVTWNNLNGNRQRKYGFTSRREATKFAKAKASEGCINVLEWTDYTKADYEHDRARQENAPR